MRRPFVFAARLLSSLFQPISPMCCFAAAVALVSVVTGPAIAVETSGLQDVDPPAKHPVLQPFDVAEKKLPANLFLVRTRGELPKPAAVTVHGSHNGVFLVSGKPAKVHELAKKGCAVLSIRDLPTPPPSRVRRWLPVASPDPDIADMVGQVNWEQVRAKIQWLVDFGTRYSFAPNHRTVAESLHDAFVSYGLQTNFRPFKYMGAQMWTVEATQIGSKYPNSYVIICGHFDSLSELPMNSAPGADDNATGTAAVLTAAEILSQHTFDYSIRYICFAGEEQGLVGSYFYATEALMENTDIVGVLNFDMLGFWRTGVDKDLEIETNNASIWLAEAVINAAELYTGTPYELHVYDWAWWGDHFWFWLRGYSAVNHEEAWDWGDPDFNPYYHTARDL
ncbi:MAG: M28 family peptidase, partial [Candidatus Latescibacterota bacterium]